MANQSAVNDRSFLHLLGIVVLGVFSLYLVVQFAVYADPRQTGASDYSLSWGDTLVFALNGLTVPLQIWLELAALEGFSLWGAVVALRASSGRISSMPVTFVCGIGYIVCAVIPLYFSQISTLMFG